MFVSPLFDLVDLTLYADDNYIVRWNTVLQLLIDDMCRSLEMITKWLRQSGLKVNDSKTEVCLFHRQDKSPVILNFNNTSGTSKNSMNVLGVTFDSKLNWQPQIQRAISNLKKALHAVHLIRKFLKKDELLKIVTSNYYSIRYFNTGIWLLATLCHNSKKNLLSALAAP